eukprot:GILI01005712.1.p1 GENE.GILI01005712.1~~GILI01005712.1.p1  ORF type:complete len:1765 (-),score=398.11 GILI01005712.1:98-4681(-)
MYLDGRRPSNTRLWRHCMPKTIDPMPRVAYHYPDPATLPPRTSFFPGGALVFGAITNAEVYGLTARHEALSEADIIDLGTLVMENAAGFTIIYYAAVGIYVLFIALSMVLITIFGTLRSATTTTVESNRANKQRARDAYERIFGVTGTVNTVQLRTAYATPAAMKALTGKETEGANAPAAPRAYARQSLAVASNAAAIEAANIDFNRLFLAGLTNEMSVYLLPSLDKTLHIVDVSSTLFTTMIVEIEKVSDSADAAKAQLLAVIWKQGSQRFNPRTNELKKPYEYYKSLLITELVQGATFVVPPVLFNAFIRSVDRSVTEKILAKLETGEKFSDSDDDKEKEREEGEGDGKSAIADREGAATKGTTSAAAQNVSGSATTISSGDGGGTSGMTGVASRIIEALRPITTSLQTINLYQFTFSFPGFFKDVYSTLLSVFSFSWFLDLFSFSLPSYFLPALLLSIGVILAFLTALFTFNGHGQWTETVARYVQRRDQVDAKRIFQERLKRYTPEIATAVLRALHKKGKKERKAEETPMQAVKARTRKWMEPMLRYVIPAKLSVMIDQFFDGHRRSAIIPLQTTDLVPAVNNAYKMEWRVEHQLPDSNVNISLNEAAAKLLVPREVNRPIAHPPRTATEQSIHKHVEDYEDTQRKVQRTLLKQKKLEARQKLAGKKYEKANLDASGAEQQPPASPIDGPEAEIERIIGLISSGVSAEERETLIAEAISALDPATVYLDSVGVKCPLHNCLLVERQQTDCSIDPNDCFVVHHNVRCTNQVGLIYTCPEHIMPNVECPYSLCEQHFKVTLTQWASVQVASLFSQIWRLGFVGVIASLVFIIVPVLYFPIVQTCLLFLTCHPSFECMFPHCWADPDGRFIIAAWVVGLIAVLVGLGVPLMLYTALRYRYKILAPIFLKRSYQHAYCADDSNDDTDDDDKAANERERKKEKTVPVAGGADAAAAAPTNQAAPNDIPSPKKPKVIEFDPDITKEEKDYLLAVSTYQPATDFLSKVARMLLGRYVDLNNEPEICNHGEERRLPIGNNPNDVEDQYSGAMVEGPELHGSGIVITGAEGAVVEGKRPSVSEAPGSASFSPERRLSFHQNMSRETASRKAVRPLQRRMTLVNQALVNAEIEAHGGNRNVAHISEEMNNLKKSKSLRKMLKNAEQKVAAIRDEQIHKQEMEDLATTGALAARIRTLLKTNPKQAQIEQNAAASIKSITQRATMQKFRGLNKTDEVSFSEWARFLNEDNSPMHQLYRFLEFEYITLPPFLLLYKVVVLMPIILMTQGTLTQLVCTAVIEIVFGVYIFWAQPYLSEWVDVLYRAASTHNIALIGLSAINKVLIDLGDNAGLAITMTATTGTYLGFVCIILGTSTFWPVINFGLRQVIVEKRLNKVGMRISDLASLLLNPFGHYGRSITPLEVYTLMSTKEKAKSGWKGVGAPPVKRNSKGIVEQVGNLFGVWTDAEKDAMAVQESEAKELRRRVLREILRRQLVSAGASPMSDETLQTIAMLPIVTVSQAANVSATAVTEVKEY